MKPRPFFVAVFWMAATCAGAQVGDYPFSQHLDRLDDPIWHADLGYVSRADVKTEGGKEFGVAELDAGSGLAYFTTGLGDLDLRTAFMARIFEGNGGIGLPDQAGLLQLSLTLTHRRPDGLAIQVGIDPGLYSDFEDLSSRAVAMPFRFILLQTLTDSLSGLAGVVIFPDNERPVVPRLGLRWSPGSGFLADLAYPESKVVVAPSDLWQLAAGLRVPIYREFQLQKDDPRDRFIYDEKRFYVSLQLALSELVRLTFEGGRVFDREVDYAENASSADVEDALFLNVGIGGYL